jgi:hypothetical protein
MHANRPTNVGHASTLVRSLLFDQDSSRARHGRPGPHKHPRARKSFRVDDRTMNGPGLKMEAAPSIPAYIELLFVEENHDKFGEEDALTEHKSDWKKRRRKKAPLSSFVQILLVEEESLRPQVREPS